MVCIGNTKVMIKVIKNHATENQERTLNYELKYNLA